MKARSTLLLLALLALLCAGYYGMLRWEQHARDRKTEARRAFPETDPGAFRRISVQQEDRRAAVGERDDADAPWRIVEPLPLDASQPTWNRVAEHLAALARERVIDNPSGLADYQLDAPRLTVRAETFDGSEVTAEFGMAGPTQANRYARLNGSVIALVDENTYFELNRSLEVLRFFYLFNPGDTGVTKVTLSRFWSLPASEESPDSPAPGEESVPVTLEMRDGVWHITEPVQARANQDMTAAFVAEFVTAVCQGFIDEPAPLADYGLDPAGARVTVHTGPDTPPQTAYFGRNEGPDRDARMYARIDGQPSVFTVESRLRDLFPKTPDAFRDLRLVTRDTASIERIHYRSNWPGQEPVAFSLALDPQAGWRFTDPEGIGIDQVEVSRFISMMAIAAADRYVPEGEADFGFTNPVTTITLEHKGEETPGAILIGAPTADGESRYITQDGGTTLALTNYLAEGLGAIVLYDFQDKRLSRFTQDEVVRLALTCDGVSYVFERPAQSWRVAVPEGKVIGSNADMNTLLEALAGLHAPVIERATPPETPAEYGLDAPVLTVTATVKREDGAEEDQPTLRVGSLSERNQRQRFATVDGRPELFRIGQAFVDDFRQALKGIRDR
jgi:hypothetical protein